MLPASGYRPDIDGLRAVAVLGVLFFHFGAFLPGGFTGVDVFFVISGFLITRLITEAVLADRFSLLEFYARRVRRILPALLVVLAACLLAGWFLLLPAQYVRLGSGAIYSAFGLGNWYFLRHTGYFDEAAGQQPLLHIWSLGIEEQFYLCWPIMLWALLMLVTSRRLFVFLLSAALVLCFAYALRKTGNDPKAAFYLPHARAWELLLGGLIVFLPPLKNLMMSHALGALGVILIGWSFLTLSSHDPFPGFNALYACGGTALIVYPKSAKTLVASVLSIKPLVWAGQISFSLYLWHWPLLVFWKLVTLQTSPTPLEGLALLLASTILAYLSWRFVEVPARNLGDTTAFRRSATILASLAVVGLIGALIVDFRGFEGRLNATALQLASGADDYSPNRPRCHRRAEHDPPLERSCLFGAPGVLPTVAIWSDSHGVELGEAIGRRLGERGEALMSISYTSCPPALDYEPQIEPACRKHNYETAEFLIRNPQIRTVILATYFNRYSRLDKLAFEKGLIESASGLTAAGKKVVVIAPVIEPGFSVPQAASRAAMMNPGVQFAVARRTVEEHQIGSQDVLARLAKLPRVMMIDPANALCDRSTCPLIVNGRTVLFDNNHLSNFGADRLAAAMDFNEIFGPAPTTEELRRLSSSMTNAH